MRKLLIFTEVYDPGGHEKYIFDLTSNLEKESILFLFNNENPRLIKYVKEKKIPYRIINLKRNPEIPAFQPSVKNILRILISEITRIFNSFFNYQRLLKVFRIYQNFDDLLILTGYPGTDSCRLAARVAKKIGIKNKYFSILNNPSIPSFLESSPISNSFLFQIIKVLALWFIHHQDSKLANSIDLFVVNSDLAGKNLRNIIGISQTKLRTVYTGINIDDHINLKKLDRINNVHLSLTKKSGEIWFGMIGNLTRMKGQEYLIKSVKLIMDKIKNVEIKAIIVGGGPDYKRLIKLTNQLALTDRVILTNTYPLAISDIYRFIDVFVFTSLNESLPYSISEAMAYKLPIIATNVGGIPEQIDDGINGILVKKANVNQLAEKMIYMINNKDKWNEMGNNAYLKVKSSFSIEKMVKDFKELLA